VVHVERRRRERLARSQILLILGEVQARDTVRVAAGRGVLEGTREVEPAASGRSGSGARRR
jgi:hypothetical protein